MTCGRLVPMLAAEKIDLRSFLLGLISILLVLVGATQVI